MTRLLMTTDAVGGVWQYATELAAALRTHGVETVLAVMGPTPIRPNPVRPELVEGRAPISTPRDTCFDKLSTNGGEGCGLEVIHTNLPLDWLADGPNTVAAAGDAIAALAREHGADLVHLNSPTLAARTDFGVPVLAVAHGCVGTWWQAARGSEPDTAYAWHGEMMAAGLRRADAAVAPSAAFADALQRTYRLPMPPLVVHNGRTPPSPSDAASVDAIFTAGRLWDEVKGTALLDQVAAQLPIPIRAAGPVTGPHGEHVTTDHLTLLGTLDDAAVGAELAHRPIYVSAARFEPFGLSVLEAAAAGCPLVLSDIDTFRELWTGAALLVQGDTPGAYAAAIERVRGDEALRAHLGDAARLRAERYRPEAMAGAMAAIYEGLLAEPHQVAA